MRSLTRVRRAGAKLAEEEGLTYIHPFNDLEVATGQGHHRL